MPSQHDQTIFHAFRNVITIHGFERPKSRSIATPPPIDLDLLHPRLETGSQPAIAVLTL